MWLEVLVVVLVVVVLVVLMVGVNDRDAPGFIPGKRENTGTGKRRADGDRELGNYT